MKKQFLATFDGKNMPDGKIERAFYALTYEQARKEAFEHAAGMDNCDTCIFLGECTTVECSLCGKPREMHEPCFTCDAPD